MVVRVALSFASHAPATSNLAPLTVRCQHGPLGVSAPQDAVVVSNCALATLSLVPSTTERPAVICMNIKSATLILALSLARLDLGVIGTLPALVAFLRVLIQ